MYYVLPFVSENVYIHYVARTRFSVVYVRRQNALFANDEEQE
jgi:hypothetical protein